MQFIFHFDFSQNASKLIYNTGRRMLYFCDESMYLSGIGGPYHYIHFDFKNETFNFKLDYLINQSESQTKESLELFKKNYKQYLNLKNKDSKIIIQTNIFKKTIEKYFTAYIDDAIESMERNLGITTFKELHDYEKVNFFEIEKNEDEKSLASIVPITEILSLQIADGSDDTPVLFLGNEDGNGDALLDIKTKEILKKDYKNGYLVDVFQFPMVNDVRTAEMKAITNEFSKEIQYIKNQLNQWAKIAFKNPNGNEAQQFFIKNVLPLIDAKKKTFFQINAAHDACERNHPSFTFHLQFGELPIDKIWELYKIYDHITEEEHQNLLKLKKENPKKYSGRWPVAFFKTDNKNIYKYFDNQEEAPKTRKTLDID